MPLSKFGPFAEVFARGELPVPGHLELLLPSRPTAQVVIDRVERALSLDPSRQWVDALFDDANWRPHLVGAIALLLDRGKTLDVGSLWHAADGGSWVIPQLVVSAYFVDPDFPSRCRDRIAAVAPVSPPADLSPPERHSATGPGGTRQRSAKLLVALVTMGRRVASLADWIDRECGRPELVELMSQDIDRAGLICERWCDCVVGQFRLRGIGLSPAAN